MAFEFSGYIDNEVITIGVLIPVFKNDDEYYFQDLTSDNRYIDGFEPIYRKAFEKSYSDFRPIENSFEVNKGEKSILVIRYIDKVFYGAYSDVIHQLVSEFKGKAINSEIADSIRDIYSINILDAGLSKESTKERGALRVDFETPKTTSNRMAGQSTNRPATTGVVTATQQIQKRKTRVGIVASNKMAKTITVTVERKVKHPIYGKFLKKSTKFMAHDEEQTAGIGDTVRIMETRPLCKNKRWRLVEIIQKAK